MLFTAEDLFNDGSLYRIYFSEDPLTRGRDMCVFYKESGNIDMSSSMRNLTLDETEALVEFLRTL